MLGMHARYGTDTMPDDGKTMAGEYRPVLRIKCRIMIDAYAFRTPPRSASGGEGNRVIPRSTKKSTTSRTSVNVTAAAASLTPSPAQNLLSPFHENGTLARATRLPLAAQPHRGENNLLGVQKRFVSFCCHHTTNTTTPPLEPHLQPIESARLKQRTQP